MPVSDAFHLFCFGGSSRLDSSTDLGFGSLEAVMVGLLT